MKKVMKIMAATLFLAMAVGVAMMYANTGQGSCLVRSVEVGVPSMGVVCATPGAICTGTYIGTCYTVNPWMCDGEKKGCSGPWECWCYPN